MVLHMSSLRQYVWKFTDRIKNPRQPWTCSHLINAWMLTGVCQVIRIFSPCFFHVFIFTRKWLIILKYFLWNLMDIVGHGHWHIDNIAQESSCVWTQSNKHKYATIDITWFLYLLLNSKGIYKNSCEHSAVVYEWLCMQSSFSDPVFLLTLHSRYWFVPLSLKTIK